MTDLTAAADQFRAMHRRGEPLVLVNAWDVASAQRVVAAGGRAVATSSAAIAASLGLPDDSTAPIDMMFDAVTRIASSVDVPVSADLLDGYGLGADDLVERLLGAGAVGCNIEDSDHAAPGALLDPGIVAERIAAYRAASSSAGVDIVVNARIDAYLHHGFGPDVTNDVLARARRYFDAGADCAYANRLADPVIAGELAGQLDGPLNATVVRAGDLAAMAAAGVSRISVGPRAYFAALDALDVFAADLLG